jgi:hypothetical protein
MNQSSILEFLIPSYQRSQTLIKAINSVAIQVEALDLSNRVKITVVDDCSPNFNAFEIINSFLSFSHFVTFKQNNINKGMSLNIRDMMVNSDSDFCTILTDDDCLQQNSLKEIIETIDRLDSENGPVIGSFFVPRYSYLEDKSLHCIVCKPFKKETIIKPSSLSSLKYLHNGFILTGLFLRPKFINFKLWNENLENSFFPVIYFADLLLKYDCLFVNKNWFTHTVMNKCYWDDWGKTEESRLLRLHRDYIKAVAISSEKALAQKIGILSILCVLKEETILYTKQMNSVIPKLHKNSIDVDKLISSRVTYRLAKIIFNIYNIMRSFYGIFIYD